MLGTLFEKTIDKLYPQFTKWLKANGDSSIKGKARLKKWYEFLEYAKGVK